MPDEKDNLSPTQESDTASVVETSFHQEGGESLATPKDIAKIISEAGKVAAGFVSESKAVVGPDDRLLDEELDTLSREALAATKELQVGITEKEIVDRVPSDEELAQIDWRTISIEDFLRILQDTRIDEDKKDDLRRCAWKHCYYRNSFIEACVPLEDALCLVTTEIIGNIKYYLQRKDISFLLEHKEMLNTSAPLVESSYFAVDSLESPFSDGYSSEWKHKRYVTPFVGSLRYTPAYVLVSEHVQNAITAEERSQLSWLRGESMENVRLLNKAIDERDSDFILNRATVASWGILNGVVIEENSLAHILFGSTWAMEHPEFFVRVPFHSYPKDCDRRFLVETASYKDMRDIVRVMEHGSTFFSTEELNEIYTRREDDDLIFDLNVVEKYIPHDRFVRLVKMVVAGGRHYNHRNSVESLIKNLSAIDLLDVMQDYSFKDFYSRFDHVIQEKMTEVCAVYSDEDISIVPLHILEDVVDRQRFIALLPRYEFSNTVHVIEKMTLTPDDVCDIAKQRPLSELSYYLRGVEPSIFTVEQIRTILAARDVKEISDVYKDFNLKTIIEDVLIPIERLSELLVFYDDYCISDTCSLRELQENKLVPDERLIEIAKRKPLSRAVECGKFSDAQIFEIAKHRPFEEVILVFETFTPKQKKEIISVTEDATIAAFLTIDRLSEYITLERLVDVAKHRPLLEAVECGKFSDAQIFEIATCRPFSECIACDYFTIEQKVEIAGSKEFRDVLQWLDTFNTSQISEIFSRKVMRGGDDFPREYTPSDIWIFLLGKVYAEDFSDAVLYSLAHGITRENALFTLCVRAHMPEVEDADEFLKPLLERFGTDVQSDVGKKYIFEAVKGLREKVLLAKEGAAVLSDWEQGILEIVGSGELLHMRVTDLTYKFVQHLSGVGEWHNSGAVKPVDLVVQQSLIGKMENKKGVRYSDVEMANYYEQYLAGAKCLPDATRSVVQIFDMLPQDKRLYVAFQEGVLAPLSVLATLAVEVKNLDIGAVANICAVAREEVAQAQDRASQEKSIESFSDQIKELFRASVEKVFGLKIPDMRPEQVETILPMVSYSTHIADKDEKKTALIGFFAALRLTGKWDAFKRGEPVDVDAYLTDELRAKVKTYQEERGMLDIFFQPADSPLHIPQEKMSGLFKKLAEPSEAVLTGESRGVLDSIHSIDAMAKDILDPDNFQEGQEQLIWQLVQEFGVKKVGGALAKRFKEDGFTDEVITSDVGVRLFGQMQGEENQRLPVWQKLTKCFGQIGGFAEKIHQAGLHERIAAVDALLVPPKQIIDIFHKIGEEMSTESGVQPLTEDVEYLESLLLKNQQHLSMEELGGAQQYLSTIKKEITGLYHMRDELKSAFEMMARAAGQTTEISSRLSERIKGFQSVFEKTTSSSVTYIATMTGDLADVIPNIRQCLGCTSDQCNNDTNLTFGDRNRFLLLGRRAGDAAGSSRSDELVTVQKTVGGDQEQYSFVMDNVYGDRARDILVTNVFAVVKKMRELRRVSPDIPLDVFVTNSGLSSCNVDEQYLRTRLQKEFKGLSVQSVARDVHIAKSASGDGHYEIGGNFHGRVSSGTGGVSGVSIEWRPESK